MWAAVSGYRYPLNQRGKQMEIQLLNYDVVAQLDRASLIIETLLACEGNKVIPKDNVTVLLQTVQNCIETAELHIENMGDG
jgi:hypothetical protein